MLPATTQNARSNAGFRCCRLTWRVAVGIEPAMGFNKMDDQRRVATADAKTASGERNPTRPPDASAFIPASAVLQRLLDDAPADHFTLVWLLGHLHRRSFGFIMLLLALVAMVPGISIVAGLLLAVPALEMIAGHAAPVFPRRIATRSLPTRYLAVVRRAIPVLRYLEKATHPRWHTPYEATKRVVGFVVLLLDALLLLTPVPMIQVVPGLVIVLLSLAYLEEDGVLLSIALLLAVALMAISAAAVWGMVVGVAWIARMWF